MPAQLSRMSADTLQESTHSQIGRLSKEVDDQPITPDLLVRLTNGLQVRHVTFVFADLSPAVGDDLGRLLAAGVVVNFNRDDVGTCGLRISD